MSYLIIELIILNRPEDYIYNTNFIQFIDSIDDEKLKELFFKKQNDLPLLNVKADFTNLSIKQQYISGYTSVSREKKFEYTIEEFKKCNLDIRNLYHVAFFNLYLIHNFRRGSKRYSYERNISVFLINNFGMIIVLPSRDTGYIKLEKNDEYNYVILSRIEKLMKFDSYSYDEFSIFENILPQHELLLKLMTLIETRKK